MTSDTTPSTALSRLAMLLATRSARRGQFTLSSGRLSTLYIDARTSTMRPEGLSLIGPLALAMLRAAGWQPDSVGGLTIGADPISYAISYASSGTTAPIRAFTVRKAPKAHGMTKLIEGAFEPGDRVVIAEDVITTGGSALRAVDAVQREGGTVLGILGLVDREEGGCQALEDEGLKVHCLLTASTIISYMNPAA